METHSDAHDPRSAAAILDTVGADRERLARRARSPWWFAPGFGVLAAGFVVRPLTAPDAGNGYIVVAAIAAIALLAAYRQVSGIRFTRSGAAPGLLLLLALVATLALYSVALGLAASGLAWWVIAPALVAGGVVTAIGIAITRTLARRIARG